MKRAKPLAVRSPHSVERVTAKYHHPLMFWEKLIWMRLELSVVPLSFLTRGNIELEQIGICVSEFGWRTKDIVPTKLNWRN